MTKAIERLKAQLDSVVKCDFGTKDDMTGMLISSKNGKHHEIFQDSEAEAIIAYIEQEKILNYANGMEESADFCFELANELKSQAEGSMQDRSFYELSAEAIKHAGMRIRALANQQRKDWRNK